MPTRPPPAELCLDLALTARCPLRCRFCPVEKDAAPEELAAAQWRQLIGGFARLRRLAEIRLEGGEPLVRRDLPEILAAALAGADQVKLVTSGAVPFAALPAGLARHPRFTLEVSVDGPEETHNRLRDGSFAAARAFIAEARRHGIRLRLRSVVSAFNIGQMASWLADVDRWLADRKAPVGFRFDTLIAPEALAGAGGPVGRPGFRRYASEGLLPSATDVIALYTDLSGRRFRRLVFEQTEAFRGCGVGRRPALAFDPAGRFSLCCEAPESLGSIADMTPAACLALLDREMASLPCRTCAHLREGRCDGCWTGQKCGMVGHWGVGSCFELVAGAAAPRSAGALPR
jgi:hypothetical protein